MNTFRLRIAVVPRVCRSVSAVWALKPSTVQGTYPLDTLKLHIAVGCSSFGQVDRIHWAERIGPSRVSAMSVFKSNILRVTYPLDTLKLQIAVDPSD